MLTHKIDLRLSDYLNTSQYEEKNIAGSTLQLRASLVPQLVKNPPVMRETCIPSLGWEVPLEKGKATHSSILAWRILWIV